MRTMPLPAKEKASSSKDTSAKGNANFAWVPHFIHHVAPHGMAGFVLANGRMSSNQAGEGDIRRALRKLYPERSARFGAN